MHQPQLGLDRGLSVLSLLPLLKNQGCLQLCIACGTSMERACCGCHDGVAVAMLGVLQGVLHAAAAAAVSVPVLLLGCGVMWQCCFPDAW